MLIVARRILAVNLCSYTSDLLMLISVLILIGWFLPTQFWLLLTILALLSRLRGRARPYIVRPSSLLLIRILDSHCLSWSYWILVLLLLLNICWLLRLKVLRHLLLFFPESIDSFGKSSLGEAIFVDVLWVVLLNLLLDALQSLYTSNVLRSWSFSRLAVVLRSNLVWLHSGRDWVRSDFVFEHLVANTVELLSQDLVALHLLLLLDRLSVLAQISLNDTWLCYHLVLTQTLEISSQLT